MFTCLIDNYNYTVSLLIDGIANSSKLHRIESQPILEDDKGFVYTLTEATPTDNGTVFSCIATGDGAELRTSNLTISVECEWNRERGSGCGQGYRGVISIGLLVHVDTLLVLNCTQ